MLCGTLMNVQMMDTRAPARTTNFEQTQNITAYISISEGDHSVVSQFRQKGSQRKNLMSFR